MRLPATVSLITGLEVKSANLLAVPSSSRTQAVSRITGWSPASWALPVTPKTSSTAASSNSPALSAEMRYWTVLDVSPIANVTRLLAEL